MEHFAFCVRTPEENPSRKPKCKQILVARTCTQFALDSCKVANSVEYCYCSSPLCNGDKTMPGQNLSANSTRRTSSSSRGKEDDDTQGFWNKEGLTDDEDLLANIKNHHSSKNPGQGGTSDDNIEGSGGFESSDSNSNSGSDPGIGLDSKTDSEKTESGRSEEKSRQYSGANIPASSNKGKVVGGITAGTAESTIRNVPIFPLISTIVILVIQYLYFGCNCNCSWSSSSDRHLYL